MAFKPGPLALASALAAVMAVVQPRPAAAQPVVQPLPPPALGELQAALGVLARNPEDLAALVRAGMASLDLDDSQAALGFFRRAEAVDPANGEVKAGLALIELRHGSPVEAVNLFAQAEANGAPMARFAGDRGLALDLVGSNLAAQQYYRQAMQVGDDPEIVRRLALSQAIAGDRSGSEATLLPLLQRSDLAAYRARAFALAILGRTDEAISIAQTMLTPALSNGIAPYLRYMPRLTRAQQAAAANLGRFPPAAEIGRDIPAIAAISGQQAPAQMASRTPDSRLEPAGEPLGAGNRQPGSRSGRNQAQPAPRERRVVGRTTQATTTPLEPPPAAQPEPSRVVVAAAEPSRQAAESAPRPSFSIAEPSPQLSESAEEPVEVASLADAFADFSLPPGEAARPASGAVDITRIDPPRERPKAAEPPQPPAHPRRFWVQVATGRDVSALAWDWRRIKRAGGELLADRDAFTARWGQTNRLVTGPFPNASAAQQAVTDLKAEGLDTFAFTSSEGEAVSPLR